MKIYKTANDLELLSGGSMGVTIYRAVPEGVTSLRNMDYVTKSVKWAKGHAEHVAVVDMEPSVVLRFVVKSTELIDAANNGEYRYVGEPKEGKVIYRTEGKYQ